MTPRRCAAVLAIFSAATLASALYRYLSADGGEKGLWFGVVMSAVGAAATLAVATGRRTLGLCLGAFAVLTVGGWFVYEALVLKGYAQAEPRQLGLIALAAATGCALVAFGRSGTRANAGP